MDENNDHLLAGAWWVTLQSPDLLQLKTLDMSFTDTKVRALSEAGNSYVTTVCDLIPGGDYKAEIYFSNSDQEKGPKAILGLTTLESC